MPGQVPQKILNAALEEFARKGYDGARMEGIAKAAGVNKATIYYHLGDKETLYRRVLGDVVTAMADRAEENSRNRTSDPVEKMKNHIAAIVEAVDKNTAFAPILLRELSYSGERLPDEMLEQLGRIIKAVASILNEGARHKVFRKADAMPVHLMIVGATALYASTGPMRTRLAKAPGGPGQQALVPIKKMAALVADHIVLSLTNHSTTAGK